MDARIALRNNLSDLVTKVCNVQHVISKLSTGDYAIAA